MPANLDMPKVLRAIRKAYNAKRLGAQHFEYCQYDYREFDRPDVGCAIGVALPKQTRDKIAREGHLDSSVRTLINAGLITVPKDQISDLVVLQAAHDSWAQDHNTEEHFLRRLSELEVYYVR